MFELSHVFALFVFPLLLWLFIVFPVLSRRNELFTFLSMTETECADRTKSCHNRLNRSKTTKWLIKTTSGWEGMLMCECDLLFIH